MNQIKAIRERLSLTQKQMADLLGMSQGNVNHYEVRGQLVKPEVARRLIEISAERGLAISFDHVYGAAELPPAPDAQPETVDVKAA